MTDEESILLDSIEKWRKRTISKPIRSAKYDLRDQLPKSGDHHEPEVKSIMEKLESLAEEADEAIKKIIDRKLRELRILGMK